MIKYITYITLILLASLPAGHADVLQPESTSMWDKVASLFHTEDNDDTDTLPVLLDANKETNEFNNDSNTDKNGA